MADISENDLSASSAVSSEGNETPCKRMKSDKNLVNNCDLFQLNLLEIYLKFTLQKFLTLITA